MKKEKISIIIPAHNEQACIERAVQSVLNSNYPDFEIIVVNDGSTDGTKKIVERMIKENLGKIKLRNFDQGHSPAFAKNRGAEIASGDIFFFLDADEWIEPHILMEIPRAFAKHDVDCSIRNKRSFFAKNWRRIFMYNFMFKDLVKKNRKSRVVRQAKPGEFFCPAVIRRKIFQKYGAFDENFFWGEDREISQRFLGKGVPILVPSTFFVWNDPGDRWFDFNRRARYIARGILLRDQRPWRIFRIAGSVILSLVLFPIFYILFALRSYLRLKDLLVALTSPFLFIFGRLLTLFYLPSEYLRFRKRLEKV